MEATKASDVTQRRVTAAKKYIEEMYKSQAQALRDRRKRRSLLEQELKQNTNLPTQVSQRYILYILREREEAKGLSGRGGLGKRRPRHFVHVDSVTTAPPPHTHTHIHTTSSKSESSLPPASCLGGGGDPPPCTGKTLADHTTVVTCFFFLLLFFVLSCRSRRRG